MTHPDEQAEQIRRELEEEALAKPSMQMKLQHLQEAAERAEKYPECTKLSAHHDEILELQRFLDWCDEKVDGRARLVDEMEYVIEGRRLELLLYQYFEIDPRKLEDERRAILEEQRKLNGQPSGE